MKIDLYFACWNNADILGFLFRHYDRFIRRYFVYDDGSTDGSLSLLAAHPKVEIGMMPRAPHGYPHMLAAMDLLETMWREKSSDADWVMICDVDEHLYHPDLLSYLSAAKAQGITIIPALGYQMLSESLPTGGLLCNEVTHGAPFLAMNKLNLFSPQHIERLNYSPGRHCAAPTGKVIAPDRDEILLLHYKYLGFERVMRRHAECAIRLRTSDRERGWGHRYFFDREQLRGDWQSFEERAIDVIAEAAPWASHPEPRWWDCYRRTARELLSLNPA